MVVCCSAFSPVNYSYDTTINKKGKLDLYWYLKKKYTGELRDQLITWDLLEQSELLKLSDEKVQDALNYVHDETARKELLPLKGAFAAGSSMLDFPFKDSLNNIVKLSDFKGKVVLIDMWFTGCGGCIEVAKAMPKVESVFEDNPTVVFVSLSIDRNKEDWKKSIRPLGRTSNSSLYHYSHYTTATTRYIYTGGSGYNNAFIKKYVPSGTYPHLMLVGKDTRVFSSSPPKPDDDAPGLIALIKKALNKPQ